MKLPLVLAECIYTYMEPDLRMYIAHGLNYLMLAPREFFSRSEYMTRRTEISFDLLRHTYGLCNQLTQGYFRVSIDFHQPYLKWIGDCRYPKSVEIRTNIYRNVKVFSFYTPRTLKPPFHGWIREDVCVYVAGIILQYYNTCSPLLHHLGHLGMYCPQQPFTATVSRKKCVELLLDSCF